MGRSFERQVAEIGEDQPEQPTLISALRMYDRLIDDAMNRLDTVKTSNGAAVLHRSIADLTDRRLKLLYDHDRIVSEREARLDKEKRRGR